MGTGAPVASVYMANFASVNLLRKIAPLGTARFGHAAIWMNHEVYAMGGYANHDDENASPEMLTSCEKYSFTSQEWREVASMPHGTAFSGCCRVFDNVLYVMGGF